MADVSKQNSEELPNVPIDVPLELIDKSIGKKVRILLTGEKEFVGTLLGFDDFVNMVLENAQEYDNEGPSGSVLKKMLLNGGHVSMIIPLSAA